MADNSSGVFGFLDDLGTGLTNVAGRAVDAYSNIATAQAIGAAQVADQTQAAKAATLSGSVNVGGNTLLWAGIAIVVLVGAFALLRRRG